MEYKRVRRVQLTLNNPTNYGLSHDVLKKRINMTSPRYFCMADEVGLESQTPHTHIFIVWDNAKSWSTIQSLTDDKAHIEICKGTNKENKDYTKKVGKWADDPKADTSVDGTFEEFGDLSILDNKQGRRNDLELLYDLIEDGWTTYEILKEHPRYIDKLDYIDRVRNIIKAEEYSTKRRDNVEVVYVYGDTGTGKSSKIRDYYGDSHIYAITDYDHPFDNYNYEDVIVFEEFRGQRKLSDMLQLLDVYALQLPCRYQNKYAAYTKVFICSNQPLNQLYTTIQEQKPKDWDAFKRRITTVCTCEMFQKWYVCDADGNKTDKLYDIQHDLPF